MLIIKELQRPLIKVLKKILFILRNLSSNFKFPPRCLCQCHEPRFNVEISSLSRLSTSELVLGQHQPQTQPNAALQNDLWLECRRHCHRLASTFSMPLRSVRSVGGCLLSATPDALCPLPPGVLPPPPFACSSWNPSKWSTDNNATTATTTAATTKQRVMNAFGPADRQRWLRTSAENSFRFVWNFWGCLQK